MNWLCKVFLVYDRRATVTFGPSIRTVKGKLLFILMMDYGRNPSKKIERINSARPARQIEWSDSLKKLKCESRLKGFSKAKANSTQGNLSKISREHLSLAAHKYDKNYQDLVEEVNTKRSLGYKLIEDSDLSNKLKVLFQQIVHLLEEELHKQFQRCNKFAPYPENSVEEHLQQATDFQAALDVHWLAYISKGTQPSMNTGQRNTRQTVNERAGV